jgi:hypothetical protein
MPQAPCDLSLGNDLGKAQNPLQSMEGLNTGTILAKVEDFCRN